MFVYLAGALIVLWFALAGVPGGIGEVLDFGAATGRFTMFNFGLDFFRPTPSGRAWWEASR